MLLAPRPRAPCKPAGCEGKLDGSMYGCFFGWRRRAAVALAAVACAPAACSLAVWSAEEQCKNDGDCAQRGAAFAGSRCDAGTCVASSTGGTGGAGGDPIWGCLGAPQEDVMTPIRVTFLAVNIAGLSSMAPLAGMTVRTCPRRDLDCVVPGDTQTTDENGQAFFDLTGDFDGYFEGSAPGVRTILFFPGPLPLDGVLPAIGGLSAEQAEGISNGLLRREGDTPRPGLAVLGARDCSLGGAEGVTFSVDGDVGDVVSYYIKDGLPFRADEGGAVETDDDGQGGFIDLAEQGFYVFNAERAETGERIAQVSAFTRADTITFVTLSARR